MQIVLQELGKRFNQEWIFRNINLNLNAADQYYAITGPNGSGKSTFLQVLMGSMLFSHGSISYHHKGKNIPAEKIYQYLSFVSPYMELLEEFTLSELLQFHLRFKKFRAALSPNEFMARLGLEKSAHKRIQYFSSGMKQRVKLGLAFYSDSPLLLLDEPTSNLDAQGIEWYQEEIKRNTGDRLCVIASNQAHEYAFCQQVLDIQQFK